MESVVEITGLNKFYGRNHVLKNINLRVEKGDVLVICGPSGAGKSTLLRCINRLENFETGTVRVLGKDVKIHTNLIFIRRNTGMVFQHFNLFPHLTVLDNIIIAPIHVKKVAKHEAVEKAKILLQRVGLSEKLMSYPHQLSGGEKQRVAIARALAMDPEIMMFDEPTSALDPEMIKEVLNVMVDLANGGMTMIVVTHEMGFAKQVSNKIAFMDKGEIIEFATKESFFSNPTSQRAREFLSKIL
ncbi:ABC transporter related [Pseudothermotoga lettingae TMO]|uniref:ABC transporter related n=1 Tax=Pseudothermotoga lettingae (strain ATCC BAA-301 / DSM 14385 / NBRC 107922 / TMO) TaxID=416591 RepID=A8F360_PSELT|nr:ABC transporter related [Pseudothermotoga lettingae TMO]GLI48419.1 amino acid ABC transporter ATP-binding protein [Pseudothermotoga lettingae TMO]